MDINCRLHVYASEFNTTVFGNAFSFLSMHLSCGYINNTLRAGCYATVGQLWNEASVAEL